MIRDFFKRRFGFYDLEELTTEAFCGLCGRSMQDVVPKDWPWSICGDHTEGPDVDCCFEKREFGTCYCIIDKHYRVIKQVAAAIDADQDRKGVPYSPGARDF